ncbi:MAG: thioredoxin family protein [Candidatus Neomarinimicrobiota bacterium]
MVLLNDSVREEIKKRFVELVNPVKIVNFTQMIECDYCGDTRRIMEEVAGLSDKISLEVFNFIEDKDQAAAYHIDKIPATVVMGERDVGIRFYGIPSGYEFVTLLEDIVMVSEGDSGLAESTRQKLAALTDPVHLQVFVTPTCPYCPRVVHLAHQFALESDKVVADMVEVIEFPHLGQRYGVMGVPKTVANEQSAAEGALPEAQFLERVLMAAGKGARA